MNNEASKSKEIPPQSTSVEVMQQLKECGLSHSFKLVKDGLLCIESEETYRPEQLKLEAIYRFEGASNPEDSEAIYVLRASDGTGGTIVDSFGTRATPGLSDFLKRVPDNREESEIPINIPARKTIVISVKEKKESSTKI